MGFSNLFTDDPLGFKLPEGKNVKLISISLNPYVKDRDEYIVTYWVDIDGTRELFDEPENQEDM